MAAYDDNKDLAATGITPVVVDSRGGDVESQPDNTKYDTLVDVNTGLCELPLSWEGRGTS